MNCLFCNKNIDDSKEYYEGSAISSQYFTCHNHEVEVSFMWNHKELLYRVFKYYPNPQNDDLRYVIRNSLADNKLHLIKRTGDYYVDLLQIDPVSLTPSDIIPLINRLLNMLAFS